MLNELESLIDYKFNNKNLINEALTHPSITHKNKKKELVNYERLEFLGDAVLGLVIAELLLYQYPNEDEGGLAKRLAALVKGESLAEIAINLGIGKYIKMSDGEESMGGRNNPRNIENTLEAIIGAIYLDGGLEPASDFIKKHWQSLAQKMLQPPKDPKTHLQEWAQGNGYKIPEYDIIEMVGPSHAPIFTVRLSIEGQEDVSARGDSKKKAEREAATIMLKKLGL